MDGVIFEKIVCEVASGVLGKKMKFSWNKSENALCLIECLK